MKYDIG